MHLNSGGHSPYLQILKPRPPTSLLLPYGLVRSRQYGGEGWGCWEALTWPGSTIGASQLYWFIKYSVKGSLLSVNSVSLMCCSHTADTSAFNLDGCELKTPVCAVPAIHSPFFWDVLVRITTRDKRAEILINQQNGGFAWLIPHNLSSNTSLRCCSQAPALTDTPALHLQRLSASHSRTGLSWTLPLAR